MGVFKKYFALTSLAALFNYIDLVHKLILKPKSIRFLYSSMDGTMFVDSTSSKSLEVVDNLRDHKSNVSLFGAIDKTKTAMGKRFLKSTLLQPMINQQDISDRLDAVQELIDNRELSQGISSVLNGFCDLQH